MSDHEYTPKSKAGKWFNDRLPLLTLANHLTDYPTPKNLNYWWTFGGILTFCLITQIITGLTLAMHYIAHADMAFESVWKISKKFQKNILGAKKDPNFWASGISIVMHMQNPHIPAMHFNTRFICTKENWFGGGMDVTPTIKDKNEKKNFHKRLKLMCDQHDKKYYSKYKKWCDEYFYLPHRDEARGIGGIFFDYKKDNFEKDFKFVRDVGVTFQMLFNNIVRKKVSKKWTLKEKEKQYIKRGRYAEFNLLYDRGTKFGLQTGGNVEGILMSLPPIAKWK